MIPVAPSPPGRWRALGLSIVGGAFVALSIYSMGHGSFRVRGRRTEVTAASEPLLFWGMLGVFLFLGLMMFHLAFRDVRTVSRRRRR
jgi:hypothetical protein